MQILSTTLTVMSLMMAAATGTIVRWHGCGGEYQQTETVDDGCTNVSGFKTVNLCSVVVPPPGTDRCEFYTNACWNPFGGATYYCNAGQTCNAASWDAIDSYRCYPQ
ncbi:hypothetical protein BJX61DRAFT_118096 [Aspergillus egyptiacus]|nr:hypothetical protein BJX61DRAFT_118096 [Aspergillus egyptiacus]